MELSPDVIAELDRAAEEPITIDLTTVGRRSGAAQRIEIWLVNIDGRLVIGGTPGPRDWLANVRSSDAAIVHFKEGTLADFTATATEVTDESVLRDIYSHESTDWYRAYATIDELVANAPTIELTLLAPA